MTRPTVEEMEARVREALRTLRKRDHRGTASHLYYEQALDNIDTANTDLAARAREMEATCACLVYVDGLGEPTGQRNTSRCPVHGSTP